MPPSPIPDGYHAVTPYLIVEGAAEALRFYGEAFGAELELRLDSPDGETVMHAEVRIGDSRVMLADGCPEMDAHPPAKFGGSPVSLLLYTEDVDAMFAQALAAGAKQVRPPENQFYGDRMATVDDPFGHRWSIATHIEDVAHDEVERRFAELMKQKQAE